MAPGLRTNKVHNVWHAGVVSFPQAYRLALLWPRVSKMRAKGRHNLVPFEREKVTTVEGVMNATHTVAEDIVP